MTVKSLLMVFAVVCASCSDDRAPTEPGGQPLPLTAGTYSLYLAGNSFTCNDILIPQTHTVVQALATANLSGTEWVFTPVNQAHGDFDLRLTAGTTTSPGAVGVSGTARGQVLHSYGVTPGLPAERASFSTLQVNGELSADHTTVTGRLGGQVVFARANLAAVCPPGQVTFVLNLVAE
jgi:hypothetical protein